MITEVLPINPSHEQIRAACDKLREGAKEKYYRAKFIIEFTKPTEVIRGGHWVTLNKMRVNTFKSKDGAYCYTFGSRRGWSFDKIDYNNIKSISMPTYEEATKSYETKALKNVMKALSLIHPNAWDDLKIKLMESPKTYEHYGNFLKIVRPTKFKCTRADGTPYIMNKSVFPESVLESIKKAFENKTDYNFEGYCGRNAQVRVECSAQPNGFIKAWYTRTLNVPKKPSKYSSGGRDFCYLLLNPTTAWFVERD
jgi:hypothetical protein